MSTDESPPVDDEERYRRLLDETGYDADLGLEMARDAQRVSAGDLSEVAFYERYHDRIVEEFATDEREIDLPEPDAAGGDTGDGGGYLDRLGAALSGMDPDGEESRRSVMKKGAAAAGALGLAGWGTAQNAAGQGGDGGAGAGDDDPDTRWGMTVNLNNCDGCLACAAACSQEHGLSEGANWMYVFAFEDEGQEDESLLPRTCQHCTDSPCTKVCPVGARHTRAEDGLVLTDYDICIGCRYCEVSCPYGVNYFQWGEPDVPDSEIPDEHQIDDRGRWVGARPPEGVMGKCTFCVDRQDGQMGEEKVGTTACEEACSMDAVHFGDLNDPESAPNRHLREYRDEHENDTDEFPDRKEDTVSTFKLLEERGTEPNVTFIGDEPSPHAEQVDGPVSYEEVGLVDNRKEVLDEGGAAAGGETA
ncbi:4Fe-4S ferredoxin N-terminal domain-containing protein [Halorubrum sp. AD140]|uniref:4Fe-4S ferredoxin N-terminal domain-containing protein n=1 Tax=Halorubrum sp. AD140 TaxID=3050073 RepID=UPI002ACCA7CD|nr:4Fe-4S ferredoxin N-terminal domain-containing protein [Halorubrum sp. AD140]MDZ5811592.1 4Fe-4S ferredoxin N-terminal domain-containing protein [Halorubrum sp. AD140]